MIIDVLKTITGNVSSCLKKGPDMKTTGSASNATKECFYMYLLTCENFIESTTVFVKRDYH